jgi:protease-4
MKKPSLFLACVLLVLIAQAVWGQSPESYYSRNSFLMAPSSTFEEGLVGFSNPANLALLKSWESRFHWSTDNTDASSFKDWGFFSGTSGFGFSVLRQKAGAFKVTDYRLSTGLGSQGMAWGLSYGWSSGDRQAFNREKLLSAGTVMRPARYLSFGLTGNFSLESNQREGVAELGIRPLGNDFLTLFADAAWTKDIKLMDAPWSAGAAVQVLPGIHLVGRTFENDAFTAGLTINFGYGGIGGQSHFDADQKHAYNSYMLRSGGLRPSVFTSLFEKGRGYVSYNLKGRVDYQKYALFDQDTHRFIDILNDIRAAADDPRIGAIVLNLSSMSVHSEHAWEIREELKKARSASKQVIVFMDGADMTSYHLASVADKIVFDPEGTVLLEGYVMGRTFLKGTLDKLGLGFDEWRFYKYKSAMEPLSREKMSDADREQRQDYVDTNYELTRADVCEGRHISLEQFDSIINEKVVFSANVALKEGLVDTLARWSAKEDVLKKLLGQKLSKMRAGDLMANALPQREWGSRPKIALVYGLGATEMESGIKARQLERVLLNLEKDDAVKAIVFRVDSPGGLIIPSDMVAEALKKCRAKKPVIVSQGQVAGSGGYWISMYGDTIVAGPNSITGSIGVIGGWIYDNGFGAKLGLSGDFVKRGDHADFLFPVTVPLLGIPVPARNLTPDERLKVEEYIKQSYEVFVAKVAQARGKSVDEIKKIAEGHFYSGEDGKEIGLVDEIGGLFTALAIAKQRIGLKADQEVDIEEFFKSKGFFPLPGLTSSIKTKIDEDPTIRYIRLLSEHPGEPVPMMLPGSYPSLK